MAKQDFYAGIKLPEFRATTINGITVPAAASYSARDARVSSSWISRYNAGPNLNPYSTTGTIGFDLLGMPKAIQGDGINYWTASADDGAGDPRLHDIAFHARLEINSSANQFYAAKDSIAPALGWTAWTSAGKLGFWLTTSGNGTVTSSAVTAGTLVDYWIFIDRDEASSFGAQAYVNATASGGGVDLSSKNVDIDSNGVISVFARQNGTFPCDNTFKLSEWGIYLFTDWFPGGADNLTVWQDAAETYYAAYGENL